MNGIVLISKGSKGGRVVYVRRNEEPRTTNIFCSVIPWIGALYFPKDSNGDGSTLIAMTQRCTTGEKGYGSIEESGEYSFPMVTCAAYMSFPCVPYLNRLSVMSTVVCTP